MEVNKTPGLDPTSGNQGGRGVGEEAGGMLARYTALELQIIGLQM